MENQIGLDKHGAPGYDLDVTTSDMRNSSAAGSPAVCGLGWSSHITPSQAAGDLPALPHPTTTPRGSMSDNRPSVNRAECPLCCVPNSIPSGSGETRDTSNLNSDQPELNKPIPPSFSAAGGSETPQRHPSTLPNGLGQVGIPRSDRGFLWSLCCECGKLYGLQLTIIEQDGQISHGYCPGCGPTVIERFLGAMAWVVLLVPWCLVAGFLFSEVQHA